MTQSREMNEQESALFGALNHLWELFENDGQAVSVGIGPYLKRNNVPMPSELGTILFKRGLIDKAKQGRKHLTFWAAKNRPQPQLAIELMEEARQYKKDKNAESAKRSKNSTISAVKLTDLDSVMKEESQNLDELIKPPTESVKPFVWSDEEIEPKKITHDPEKYILGEQIVDLKNENRKLRELLKLYL